MFLESFHIQGIIRVIVKGIVFCCLLSSNDRLLLCSILSQTELPQRSGSPIVTIFEDLLLKESSITLMRGGRTIAFAMIGTMRLNSVQVPHIQHLDRFPSVLPPNDRRSFILLLVERVAISMRGMREVDVSSNVGLNLDRLFGEGAEEQKLKAKKGKRLG